jgi:hypothetical protein
MKRTMIRNSFLAAALAVGIVGSVHAQQLLLSDNFNGYADQAAFNAAWTPLSAAMTYDAVNGWVTQGTAAQSSYQGFAATPGALIDLRFDMFDPAGTNAGRSFVALQARQGDTIGGTLDQIIAFGRYNNQTAGGAYYYGRVAFGSGMVYADGALAPTSSWFKVTGGGTATQTTIGWHSMRLVGAPDPTNPETHFKLSFYVDDVLAGTVANIANANFNFAVLGSGLTSTAAGASFDNLVISAIPEPSTYAAIFGGLALLGAFVYRRRLSAKK